MTKIPDDIDVELTAIIPVEPKARKKEPEFSMGPVKPCDPLLIENGLERVAEYSSVVLSRVRRKCYSTEEEIKEATVDKLHLANLREAMSQIEMINAIKKANEKPAKPRMA